MGWRGTLRTVTAAANRAAREHDRKTRARQKEIEIQAAEDAVIKYESYLEEICTLHHNTAEKIDWDDIGVNSLPPPPIRDDISEKEALMRLNSYDPGFLRRLVSNPQKARMRLEKAVEKARRNDLERFENDKLDYEERMAAAQKEFQRVQPVLSFEPEAMKEWFEQHTTLADVAFLRDSVGITFSSDGTAKAEIFVHSEDIVPDEKFSQLASGKLSVKKMPKKEYYAIYQDYVCSAAIMILIELNNILPIKSVFVNVKDNILNKSNGHIEESIILSFFAPRESIEKINFDAIDPSDCMSNFLHEMRFRATSGFEPVAEVTVPGSRQKS